MRILKLNLRNQVRHKTKSSVFKGVNWHPKSKKWQARITKNGTLYHLGVFHTQEEAAAVYDKAALDLHKVFACINLPT